MKRKNILAVIALIAVLVMALAGCGSDDAVETSSAAETQAAVPGAPLSLSGWSLSPTTWSSPNGATIHLTATPTSYTEGQTAAFCVRLEGDEVANIPCDWDGANYTAAAELNAADGYCYYVILTAADGTQTEVAVNTPSEPVDEALINMESSLNSYCNLMVDEIKTEAGKLTIISGSIQVQLPRITNAGETITCSTADVVLQYNGEEIGRKAITLSSGENQNSYEASVSDVTFEIPSMEDDQQLDLWLEANLSNGQQLTSPGGSLFYNGGDLLPAVG